MQRIGPCYYICPADWSKIRHVFWAQVLVDPALEPVSPERPVQSAQVRLTAFRVWMATGGTVGYRQNVLFPATENSSCPRLC